MLTNRGFKGIWIPAEIWMDTQLNMLEKGILMEIDSLDCDGNGCYASNEYLATFCQCSETKISNAITKLKNLGYVCVKSFDGRQRILQSRLTNFVRLSYKFCKADEQDIHYYNSNSNNSNNNISFQDMQTSKEVCDTQLKTTPSGDFREREEIYSGKEFKNTEIKLNKNKLKNLKEEKDLKIIEPKQMFGNKSALKKQSSINSKIKYLVENKNITDQKFINLFKQWLDVVYDKGFIPKPIQLDLIIKKLEDIKNSYGIKQMFTVMEDTIRVGYKDFNYCAPKQFNKPVNNEYQVFNPDARLTKAERAEQLKNINYTGEKF